MYPQFRNAHFFPSHGLKLVHEIGGGQHWETKQFSLCMQHKIYVYINYCMFDNNKSSNHKFFSTSLLFRFLFQFPTFPLVFFPFCSKYLFNLLKSSNFIFLNRIEIIRQLFLPGKIFEQTYEFSLRYSHHPVFNF